MLRKLLSFSLLFAFTTPVMAGDYLTELPDRLAELWTIAKGYKPVGGGYLKEQKPIPIRLTFAPQLFDRQKLISAPKAPPDPFQEMLEREIPAPPPPTSMEVSSGADPFYPQTVIGGKRIEKHQVLKALLNPEEFLSVFEKQISKQGDPEEKIHIPFSLPYDGSYSNNPSPRIPSKATYVRE